MKVNASPLARFVAAARAAWRRLLLALGFTGASSRVYLVTYQVGDNVRRDTLLNIVAQRIITQNGLALVEMTDSFGHLYAYKLDHVIRVRAAMDIGASVLDSWPDEEGATL